MNTLNCKNNQIHFGTKYKFLSKSELSRLVQLKEQGYIRKFPHEKVIKYVNDYGSDYVYINKNRMAYTQNAASCVIYGISMPEIENGILGHYNKYPKEILESIRAVTHKCKAFIIGGNRDCEEIFYKTTLEECEKANIETSVFYGQNRLMSSTDVLFDRPNDIVYIAPSENISNINDLKACYYAIKVPNGDEIYLKDRKVCL